MSRQHDLGESRRIHQAKIAAALREDDDPIGACRGMGSVLVIMAATVLVPLVVAWVLR